MARSTAFEILAKQYRDEMQAADHSAEYIVDSLNTAKLVRFLPGVERRVVAEVRPQPGDYALAWGRGVYVDGTKALVAWCPGIGPKLLHNAQEFVSVIEDATGPILPPDIERKLGEFDRTLSLGLEDHQRLSIVDAVRGLLLETYRLGAVDGRKAEQETVRKLTQDAEAAATSVLEGLEDKLYEALRPLFRGK